MTNARQDQLVFTQLDRAFDEMENATRRLKDAGYREIATYFGSEWVKINDDFHQERVDGKSGTDALCKLAKLEDDIVQAMDEFGITIGRR